MSDVNKHKRTRERVAVLVGQIAGAMLSADWTVESVVRNAEALVAEMDRRDAVAFKANGPWSSTLTDKEREMLDNGYRVQCVKAIKERLGIPLKEAYDLAQAYCPTVGRARRESQMLPSV